MYILNHQFPDSGLYFVLGLALELARITAQIDALRDIGCIFRCDGGIRNEEIQPGIVKLPQQAVLFATTE